MHDLKNPKDFDECTAAEIVESLGEALYLVEKGWSDTASEGPGPVLFSIDRARKWVEQAGSELSGNTPWTPGHDEAA